MYNLIELYKNMYLNGKNLEDNIKKHTLHKERFLKYCFSSSKPGHLALHYCFHQFSSVAQSCPTLCDPMHCCTPGFPVHHQLLELTQARVHWVRDVIQPSHPFSSSLQEASKWNLNVSKWGGGELEDNVKNNTLHKERFWKYCFSSSKPCHLVLHYYFHS